MLSGLQLLSRTVPPDHPVFKPLPVRMITVGRAGEQMAVHIAGRPLIGRMPLICLPGYQRNMSDFSDFVSTFHRMTGDEWPIILVDLKGRGRSSDRSDKGAYVSLLDARDVAELCTALATETAVFLGQGYGGQVLMALAAQKPTLFGGAVLLDGGPVSDPRGLVRLRNNLTDLEGLRSAAGFRAMFRRMMTAEYPGAPESWVETLAARTHYLDKRGRVRTLFDHQLLKMLAPFEHDDILVPQWPLFDALAGIPLVLMRTQLTDQLRREVFDEMLRRRRDAEGYVIEGQGSPALLNTANDIAPITEFVRQLVKRRGRSTAERLTA